MAPDSYVAYLNRGILYHLRGLYNNALDDFTRAIQLNPRVALLYRKRASLYYEMKQFDLASKDFMMVAQWEPDNKEAQHFIKMLRHPTDSNDERNSFHDR